MEHHCFNTRSICLELAAGDSAALHVWVHDRRHRRLARRVGVDQRLAEHLGGAGNVADLVVHVGRRDRGALFAAGHRADRVCDRGKRLVDLVRDRRRETAVAGGNGARLLLTYSKAKEDTR